MMISSYLDGLGRGAIGIAGTVDYAGSASRSGMPIIS